MDRQLNHLIRKFRRNVSAIQNRLHGRPADLIEPQLKKLEAEMSQWKEQDEDVLSYALFPQVAVDFFKYREAQRTKVDATLADKENQTYPV